VGTTLKIKGMDAFQLGRWMTRKEPRTGWIIYRFHRRSPCRDLSDDERRLAPNTNGLPLKRSEVPKKQTSWTIRRATSRSTGRRPCLRTNDIMKWTSSPSIVVLVNRTIGKEARSREEQDHAPVDTERRRPNISPIDEDNSLPTRPATPRHASPKPSHKSRTRTPHEAQWPWTHIYSYVVIVGRERYDFLRGRSRWGAATDQWHGSSY
jgi:hypothetical protein